MTAPQFEYGGYTLDELRSLAASPQVGTIQAMPASFRALADHVGEVADLLSHAQADLPNWWKGPAADQAAATLGRAAAEAREFHGSATAAASAVSRCAQVVAEQQNQMIGVPDIPEPGVTAVVQRPATPYAALEAARQDAAYQAAHQQAVQVVNGIAAQYVETRGELALITTTSGENFTSPTAIQKTPDLNTGESINSNPARAGNETTSDTHPIERGYEQLTGPSTGSEASSSGGRISAPRYEEPWTAPNSAPIGALGKTGPQQLRPRTLDAEPGKDLRIGASEHVVDIPLQPSALNWQSKGPSPADDDQKMPSATRASGTENIAPEGRASVSDPTPSSLASAEWKLHHESIDHPLSSLHTRHAHNQRARDFAHDSLNSEGQNEKAIAADRDNKSLFTNQPLLPSQVDGTNTEGTAIVPPYTGVGPVGRARERNPRPAYLKERKSVWLPDTVAAPADGVIRPD